MAATPSVPAAADLPATRVMLGELPTDVVSRMDHVESGPRAEIQVARGEIRDVKAPVDMDNVTAELKAVKAELNAVKAELKAVKAELKADMHGLRSLAAVINRQDRHENRIDDVEQTARALASARASG